VEELQKLKPTRMFAADLLSAAALGKPGKTSASCRFSTLDADWILIFVTLPLAYGK